MSALLHLIHIDPLLFAPGDRMSREDFLARWDQMPALKRAELIDGIVYMPSPLSFAHGRLDVQMHTLLGVYAARTRVCEAVSNASWLMLQSAPQPDAALLLLPQFGGSTRTVNKLASGVPELVVEVCLSSRSYDLGPKLALYQRAGVQEYIAVLLEEQRVEWRALTSGSYQLMDHHENGVFRSEAFPGLWLDEPALWAGDSSRMLEVLDSGLASDECQQFLHRLHRA
jgi:hypothetical protein